MLAALGLLAGLLAGLFCEVELFVCEAFAVLLVFDAATLDVVLAVVAEGGRSVFAEALAFGGRLALFAELVWAAAPASCAATTP